MQSTSSRMVQRRLPMAGSTSRVHDRATRTSMPSSPYMSGQSPYFIVRERPLVPNDGQECMTLACFNVMIGLWLSASDGACSCPTESFARGRTRTGTVQPRSFLVLAPTAGPSFPLSHLAVPPSGLRVPARLGSLYETTRLRDYEYCHPAILYSTSAFWAPNPTRHPNIGIGSLSRPMMPEGRHKPLRSHRLIPRLEGGPWWPLDQVDPDVALKHAGTLPS